MEIEERTAPSPQKDVARLDGDEEDKVDQAPASYDKPCSI